MARHDPGLRRLTGRSIFKPVKYNLPHGTQGIRNPLLEECIWPWFYATQERYCGPPPGGGGTKTPPIDPQSDRRFVQSKASWQRMLFQQPPRSCIGFVEKDGWVVDGPVYTEVKVQPHGDFLRIIDVATPCYKPVRALLHPLPEEGIVWLGKVSTLHHYPPFSLCGPGEQERYGEVQRNQLAYATSIYLRDCDVVFFTQECRYIREHYNSGLTAMETNSWLYNLGKSLVPEQTSIPMPVT